MYNLTHFKNEKKNVIQTIITPNIQFRQNNFENQKYQKAA